MYAIMQVVMDLFVHFESLAAGILFNYVGTKACAGSTIHSGSLWPCASYFTNPFLRGARARQL